MPGWPVMKIREVVCTRSVREGSTLHISSAVVELFLTLFRPCPEAHSLPFRSINSIFKQ